MQILITNLLLIVIAGGIGYLVGQNQPQWFGPELRQRLFMIGWIVALLLAGALRAAAVVYGASAMFSVLSMLIGFGLGIWIALRSPDSRRS
jgi:uncharacterized membrane protein YqgA involved in biofilm formation